MQDMDEEFDKLKRMLLTQNGSVNLETLDKAWELAKLAHSGQKRKSGESYVAHPLATAIILAGWKLDTPSIVAGLLHDTVEDGGATREDIIKEFGEEIGLLVEGVTMVGDVRLRGSRDEEFIENIRKMFLAMAKDLRVVIIKLADRLHNMKTLSALTPDKQEKIAKETLEVFAPLAERLGMGEVKAQLDDLAFPFVYPKEHEKLVNDSALHYKKAEEHIKKMKRTLFKALVKEEVKEVKIDARKKHLYSLWKKLERPEIAWDFSKVLDIVALRILTNTVTECYSALGVVHSHYKPIPKLGISDFIAQPKPNGYRSIHTKVFGPGERTVEVQIRTFEMHEQAEFGVASHWHLASLKSSGKIGSMEIDEGKWTVSEEKLNWVKQLADWQKELKDSKEFLQAVKFDALSHRNFVFSPKGDVYDLPSGATPIDFAFAVHTKLGCYIKAAKVNGNIVQLDYKLKSGDVVEIVKTKKFKKPNEHWMRFVVTQTAKRAIRKYQSRDNTK